MHYPVMTEKHLADRWQELGDKAFHFGLGLQYSANGPKSSTSRTWVVHSIARCVKGLSRRVAASGAKGFFDAYQSKCGEVRPGAII